MCKQSTGHFTANYRYMFQSQLQAAHLTVSYKTGHLSLTFGLNKFSIKAADEVKWAA